MSRWLIFGALYLFIFCRSQTGLAETTKVIDTFQDSAPKEGVVDINWDSYKGNEPANLDPLEVIDYEHSSCGTHVDETFPGTEKELVSTFGSLLAKSSQEQNPLKNTQSDRDTAEELSPESAKEVIIGVYGSISRGYEYSKVVFFELSNYQCSDCARYFLEIFPEIEKEYVKTGKIKYVFLDFPPDSQEPSFKAAEAADCAAAQGKFLEMRAKLYGNQIKLDINELMAIAESLSLDMSKFRECLQSGKYAEKIRADIANGRKAGIGEAPAFLMGLAEPTGAVKIIKVIKGPHQYSDFKDAIEDLLSLAASQKGRIFYVRETVGDDSNEGLSPEKAWKHVGKLSSEMKAGDIAYVGPGLYRDQIRVMNSGVPGKMLTIMADTSGQHTGDPPGNVMITGAEPIDENIFKPYSSEGVYVADFSGHEVWGVAEMDGLQYRYEHVLITREHHVDHMPPVEIVAKLPSSYYYDDTKKLLYIHTSDGNHPGQHEIEIITRLNGIVILGKNYITISGFTFRHMGDAGINFSKGSENGIAMNNTVYGSRIGIRVRDADNITLYGNTLFRNENSGIYFLSDSDNCFAIANIAYENVKGIRWGSRSSHGFALDNILFDNSDAGLSVEVTGDIMTQRNRMVNNGKYQLLLRNGNMSSIDNCFEKGTADQLITEFISNYPYASPADQKKAKETEKQNLISRSRVGNCGSLPGKIDVKHLHEETVNYAEQARKILSEGETPKEQEK